MQEWDAGSWVTQSCKCLLWLSQYSQVSDATVCYNNTQRRLLTCLRTHSVIQPKHVVGAYQVVNAFCFLFNCYGKILPTVGHTALWTSLISFFVILVAVPAKAQTHQDAKFVFATFTNNTGWTSNGIGVSCLLSF